MEMEKTINPFDLIVNRLDSIEHSLCQLLENYHKSIKTQDVDRWMDVKGLCAYLPQKPSPESIYKLVYDRKIPHVKRGKRLYFLKSAIDEWLHGGARMMESEMIDTVSEHLADQVKNRL